MPVPVLKHWPHDVAKFAASVWLGGMVAVGYLAVPVLFQSLPDNRMLAGALAGKMFSAMAYVGMVCAAYLLAYVSWRARELAVRSRLAWVLWIMLGLVLLGQFVLQPQMALLKEQVLPLDVMHSAYAARFAALHGVASILYLVQCVFGIVVVVRLPLPSASA